MIPRSVTSSRKITSMVVLPPILDRSPGRVREQGGVARPLDGHGEATLVLRAGSRRAARHDATALAHERLQHLGPLVIERQGLLGAEAANPPATARTSEPSPRAPLTRSSRPFFPLSV